MNLQGQLIIDLSAIAHNWRTLNTLNPSSETSAVIKANAYGLGATPIAQALFEAGCRTFFVAHPEEGASVRPAIPEARIFILNGFDANRRHLYADHRLKPVLSNLTELNAWSNFNEAATLGAALHIDSGMNRLGLRVDEALSLNTLPEGVELIMSHLIDAENSDSLMNSEQRDLVKTLKARFKSTAFGFANSFGCFLGDDFAFELTRPGIALYGGQRPHNPEGFKPVATMLAPVLDVRHVPQGETIGYNAYYKADKPMTIVTIGLGYADGYMRQASRSSNEPPCAYGYFEGYKLPLVGRVSMDLITLDASSLPSNKLKYGDRVEMLGAHVPLNDVASAYKTITYEVLTQLKLCRLPRLYRK